MDDDTRYDHDTQPEVVSPVLHQPPSVVWGLRDPDTLSKFDADHVWNAVWQLYLQETLAANKLCWWQFIAKYRAHIRTHAILDANSVARDAAIECRSET